MGLRWGIETPSEVGGMRTYDIKAIGPGSAMNLVEPVLESFGDIKIAVIAQTSDAPAPHDWLRLRCLLNAYLDL